MNNKLLLELNNEIIKLNQLNGLITAVTDDVDELSIFLLKDYAKRLTSVIDKLNETINSVNENELCK